MNSLLIFVIFNILEDFILNEICEKEKPILKGDQCQNIFCSEIEYINEICQVSNSIIKTLAIEISLLLILLNLFYMNKKY